MNYQFTALQIKRIQRSSFWQKSLVTNIFIGLLMLLLLFELLAVGIFLPSILEKSAKDIAPEVLLNQGLIYYFLVTFMMRFFIQELPTMEVTPMLHLPIKKTKISSYLNFRTLLSFFNFLPLFLFLPFTIIYMGAHFSALSAISWFLSIYFFEFTSNFLLVRIKRKSSVTPSVVLILLSVAAVIGILNYYNLLPLKEISGWYFGNLIKQPLLILLPLFTMLLAYWENHRYTVNHLYLENLVKKKKRSEKISSSFSGLEKRGKTGAMILNEIRLLLRNKRSKQMLLFSLPLSLLYGMFFYPQKVYMDHIGLLVFVATFISGGFLIIYGQYILAWESTQFDFILASNIHTEEYFKAKYYLMTIPTTLLFLLTIPYVYYGRIILELNFVFLFYNLGINAPLLLFSASFNRKRLELDKGQMMNYQGVGINNFLIIIPLMGGPALIYVLLDTLVGKNIALLIILGLGILGILLHQQLIKWAAAFFRKRRYQIAEGYRNS
ncbi:MAG: hypothetical protein JXR65_04030 [Bacteroidales bacterium]|nr:hypothetical protein [Bacteroidales bacterium]